MLRSALVRNLARVSLNTVSRHWRAALILVAIVAVYANSLRGPFVLDDQASVVQNAEIRDLGRLDRVLTPLPDSPVAGRPLVNLSFAIDYAIGGLEVTSYHVANLAWHVACAWLLFGIVRRTMELPAIRDQAAAGLQTRAMHVRCRPTTWPWPRRCCGRCIRSPAKWWTTSRSGPSR